MTEVFYGKPNGWERYILSQSIVTRKCPKCGAEEEYCCTDIAGRKVWPPHTERLQELGLYE